MMDPVDPVLLTAVRRVFDSMIEDNDNEVEVAAQKMQASSDLNDLSLFLEFMRNRLQRETHYRPQGYSEMSDHYLPEDYERLFRMTQDTFDVLLSYLRNKFPTIDTPYSGGLQPVSARKKLQVALLYLSSQMSLRQIGDTLGIADSTVMIAKDDVVNMLCQSKSDFTRWPTEEEAQVVSAEFAELAGFPGVIGSIDGCHIPGKFCTATGCSYINRKMFKSVVLQGVCTAKRFLTNIYVGVSGRMHDGRIFRLSNLKKTIVRKGKRALFYNDQYHLVGDPAYSLTSYLMVRYKHRNQTAAQKKFNKRLSQTRVKIENKFGLIKGRWSRLKYVNTYKLEKISKTITACCVLHNFCLLHRDYMDHLIYQELPRRQDPLPVIPNEAVEHQLGVPKRLQITALM